MGTPNRTIVRFRRRFIAITMALVGVVSLCAFCIIGATGYQQTKGATEDVLARVVTSGEVYSNADEDKPGIGLGHEGAVSNIPVCLVSVYGDATAGAITISNTSTAYMSDEFAQKAVGLALSHIDIGQYSGYIGECSLYYKASKTSMGYRVAFADASSVMQDFTQEALRLAQFWVLLMIALFLVTIFLSRYVTRPVVHAWDDQQRFIADASHELKTPLTIILADTSILLQKKDQTIADQQVWVEGIEAEAQRMQQLTESMLTLAQADAGVEDTLVMGSVDFSSVVEGQVLQFDAVAFERQISIEDDVDEHLVVTGDELRLENTVKTLLENACKYAEKPSVVKVSLHRLKNNAVLSVTNTGNPIPPEDLDHVFDRFYRSDKARTANGEAASFGLGLSIAKTTVEQHGGSIGVTSGNNKTTFTAKIPLAK